MVASHELRPRILVAARHDTRANGSVGSQPASFREIDQERTGRGELASAVVLNGRDRADGLVGLTGPGKNPFQRVGEAEARASSPVKLFDSSASSSLTDSRVNSAENLGVKAPRDAQSECRTWPPRRQSTLQHGIEGNDRGLTRKSDELGCDGAGSAGTRRRRNTTS